MDYLLGASLGGLIAFGYSIPAIIFELIERGKSTSTPLIINVKTIFGYTLKKGEVFAAGLLLYIFTGMFFGAIYVLFVEQGWLFITHRPYTFISFFLFGLLSWIVVNVLFYPLFSMGLFGRKEGKHVWMETLISHMLLAMTMAICVQWFQPYYFIVTN